jgi:hypothetical protein
MLRATRDGLWSAAARRSTFAAVTILVHERIDPVRSTIALALTLVLPLPACEIGSSDDAAGSDTETSTTEATASDDLAGPDTDPSTSGSTAMPEPTSADPTEGGDDPTTSDPTSQGDGTGASSGSTTGGDDQPLPPTNGAELLPWLEAGEYLGWTAESGVHPSSGPHFGDVRTFVNDALLGSLEAGAAAHPAGAAAVKELYGAGGTVLGWSVEVKLQADSAGGDGWYWYERYQDSVYADGTGEGICTGCHGGGNDYVLSPFPLQ